MRGSLFSQNLLDPDMNKMSQFTKNESKNKAKTAAVFFTSFLISLFEKSSRVLYFQRKKLNYIKIHAKSGRYITKIGTFERVFHDHPLITDS